MTVHLLKTASGVADLEDLARRQQARRVTLSDGRSAVRTVTRRMPRRAEEVLAGGSLYWIVKRRILARNRILDLETTAPDEDGVRRCAILLEPRLLRVTAVPRRPIQGWRYLEDTDAPFDLPENAPADAAAEMPPEMAEDLKDLGLL